VKVISRDAMKIVSSQACLAMMARCHRTSTSHFGHHPRWAINDGQRYAIASLINSNCTLFFSPELRQCDNWWHICFSPAGISLFSFEFIEVLLSGFHFNCRWSLIINVKMPATPAVRFN